MLSAAAAAAAVAAGSLSALSAEDVGQHQLAYTTFQELLDSLEASPGTSKRHLLGDTHPSDGEQDLWYSESLQCRLALGDWAYVEQQIEADVLDAAGEQGGGGSGLPVAALLKLLEVPGEPRNVQQDQSSTAAAAAAAASSSQGAEVQEDPPHDYTSYLQPYVRACLFGGGVSAKKLEALVSLAQQQKGRLERLHAVAGAGVAVLSDA
jgi:hypothetical protein